MTGEALFGFIGEVRGNEEHVVAMDAVSVRGDEFIRYPAGEGMAPRVLKPADLAYVTPIDSPKDIDWRPGHIVWFAGRILVARSTLDPVRGFNSDWYAAKAGYRLRTGTPSSFRRWKSNIAEELSKKFRNYVGDVWEIKSGDATKAWELYAAFDSSPSKTRSINAALFFFEIEKDENRFEIERKRAVRNGAFSSVEEFDAAFDKTRNFLLSSRIADAVPSPMEAPSTVTPNAITEAGAVARYLVQDVPTAWSWLRRGRFLSSQHLFSDAGYFEWRWQVPANLEATHSSLNALLCTSNFTKHQALEGDANVSPHVYVIAAAVDGAIAFVKDAPKTAYVINEQVESQ